MVLWIGIVVAVLFVFFGIVIIRDGNRFVVREYELHTDKIKKDVVFVMLSDLHNKTYGKRNERLLEEIDRIRPAGILIAGDLLTAKAGMGFQNAADLVHDLAAKYPVYYGNGNHEQRLRLYQEDYGTMYVRYQAALEENGVEPLVNERVYLNQYHIDICGSEIERKYYRHWNKKPMEPEYLTKLLGRPNQDAYQILLAHNPEYFEEYAAWGADLVLSGHVHGGVMKLPLLGGVISPSFRLFPKYDGGIFRRENSTMLLSRGLGMHTLPVRVFNPGELVVIRLHADSHKEK